MLFYRVTAMLDDEKWVEENNDRRIKRDHNRRITRKSEDYNERDKQGIYCFVSEIDCNDITCGIISHLSIDANKLANSYFKYLGIIVKDIDVCETTFSSMQSLLETAKYGDFIKNEDVILECFDLDVLTRKYRMIEYEESLLGKETDKFSLYETSRQLLAEGTLTPELDRIYFGKTNTKAFGHPVHYILETDDRDTRNKLLRTLLQALYDNRRIKSRRYCAIDISPGQIFSNTAYDNLYKSCIEGVILVRYQAKDDTNEYHDCAISETETISELCDVMLKYRNQVLTVFCLPRACNETKRIFCENLGSVGIVEIKEDLADIVKSTEYLKMFCKDKHIRPDKTLYRDLEPEKEYFPEELRAMFNEWYNNKMRTSVFPQYKDIQVQRKETVKEVARGNAYIDLNKMIGLAEAKSVIGKALNYYKLQRVYKDKGIKQDHPAMHMVFTGNPGTAKTTVARLFARIMKENGLLSRGQLVEVSRSDLVGKFVGWTAQIVKSKFKEAMGGVLFIDEAYSLANENSGSYGKEAIDTIVQEMENRREDLVVIFAGYPDEMESFLNKNPGLRSRIAFHVPFADYSIKELCEIAMVIGRSKGISLTEKAVEKLSTVFKKAKTRTDFGNGRFVRNLIELSRMNQASRILTMDPDLVNVKTLTSLEEEDIEVPAEKSEVKKRTIGFAI